MMKSFIIFFIVVVALPACRKDSFITSPGASVTLSADTLHFDTLFTTTGSFTQAFKIFNDNDQRLHIAHISLAGGDGSFFRINADGFQGPSVSDLEVNANDSIYVFVTVSINPNAENLPFLVRDSILVAFNGNQKAVQLDAWGQNAHFYRNGMITSNTTWTNDKPYVILGGLEVNDNTVLTINKGTKIFLHADAPIVVDGTLIAHGDNADSLPIVFSGDRPDDPYNNFPGSWPGIYFREQSTDNVLDQVEIRNAYQGIVVQEQAANHAPKLTMTKCIVDNCYDAGIIGVHSSIDITNTLVSNCGKNIELVEGGQYRLTQCTVASYSNSLIPHKDPVLAVTNFLDQDNTITAFDLDARFVNCIFWGDNGIVDNEVVTQRNESAAFGVSFTNCLWKLIQEPDGVDTSGMIGNQDPGFVSIDIHNNIYDFHPGKDSPVLGAGAADGIPDDLDGNPRDLNFPDLGAYEATF